MPSSRDLAAAKRQLDAEGYAVIPGWLPREVAEEAIDLIDDYADHNSDNVQHNSDDRIFGAEHLSDEIAAFKTDLRLNEIATTYMAKPQRALFTLGNRLRATPGKKARSGGRWHHDRKARQFKALVYLTDVEVENGAFCIIPRSADAKLFEPEITATGFDFPNQRWNDSDIDPFLERLDDRVKPLTGAAGTIVLFDSSLIHSGLPISKGHRYALTNYYYAEDEIDLAKMGSKFAPAVKPFSMPSFE